MVRASDGGVCVVVVNGCVLLMFRLRRDADALHPDLFIFLKPIAHIILINLSISVFAHL